MLSSQFFRGAVLFLCFSYSICIVPQFRFTEGEPAELRFSFHNEHKNNVEAKIGKRQPFFAGGHIDNAGLSKTQQGRFTVETSVVVANTFIVHIKINGVSREDAGLYTVSLYKQSSVVVKQSLSMSIHFPPGIAQCIFEPQISYIQYGLPNSWKILLCTAPLGTQPGFISCYQNGEQLPPWTIPVSNSTILQQRVWTKQNTHPIFCCSSSFENKTGLCSCNDFWWDPMRGIMDASTGNPCGETSSSPDMQANPTSTSEGGGVTTTRNVFSKYIDPCCKDDYTNIIIVSSLCVLIPSVSYLLLTIRKELQDLKKHMQNKKSN